MIETNRNAIVRRLQAEGWANIGGGKHDRFVKEGQDMIIVPRHRTLSSGVARSIQQQAGWT